MKKIISLFLTVTMIASLIVAIPVTNVSSAETITDEALFMTYPTYLSNSEMDEGLAKAEAAYYAVINSYSNTDEVVAKDEYYILENYATKTVISLLSKFVDELIGNVTGSVHLSLIKSCIKIFCDYVYVNAKADEITQAIMQTSFVNSIDICLGKYRLKFLQGKGTTADIETYENLYAASISARIAILDACYDVAKITDKFSLGGDCLVWKDLLECNYTYDNYIKWCKETVAHDIANAELDKTTGESTITDVLNEETIKARLDKIRAISLYKPNAGNTFRDAYQTEGTLGFAALVFNRIFDREMGTRADRFIDINLLRDFRYVPLEPDMPYGNDIYKGETL